MKNSSLWVKGVMTAICYIGFLIYLLGSISHVAWFFHLYAPSDEWMAPAYIQAGSLDLAVGFLAYIAATGQTADKVMTWLFTILLSSVSLYANYIYAMFYSPEHQHDIWGIQILFGLTTTGWLSPLIASSYPLCALVFLYIIERVISKRVLTIAELQDRLAELQDRKAVEGQIKKASGPSIIKQAGQYLLEARDTAQKVLKGEQIIVEEEQTPEQAPAPEPATPQIAAPKVTRAKVSQPIILVPKKRGRKPGSKNKPKVIAMPNEPAKQEQQIAQEV